MRWVLPAPSGERDGRMDMVANSAGRAAGPRAGITRDMLGLRGWWLAFAVLLGLWFACWGAYLFPGTYTDDSALYLSQALSGELTNLKPYFYTRFLQVVTGGGRWLELAAPTQAALVVLAFSRMFAIAMVTGTRWPWIVLGLLLVLNPYVANMAFYVQNDVLFSVALVALVVESLYVLRYHQVGVASIGLFALFAPMALLFRQNGVLFLPVLLLVLAFLMPRRQALRLLLPAVGTSLLGMATMWGVRSSGPQEQHHAIYPAVVHEIARLSQQGYQTHARARLHPHTIGLLGEQRVEKAGEHYWPLYWDTIGFMPGGPQLVLLEPERQDAVVKSFLKHDLIPNLPGVLGHRLEMFLGAGLARASLADPTLAPSLLPAPLAALKRDNVREATASPLVPVQVWTLRHRYLGWNALFGCIVLLLATLQAVWRRDWVFLLCAGLLWIQWAAVVALAPSAEYRYVFMLYLAPLLLLVRPPAAQSLKDAWRSAARALHAQRHWQPGARA